MPRFKFSAWLIHSFALLLAVALLGRAAVPVEAPVPTAVDQPQILIFTKTTGWVHTSIPFGVKAIEALGRQRGFAVNVSSDATLFCDAQLKRYAAVVFLSTTGNVLNPEQRAAFERYIQAGGGFVGIHAAAATEYEWPWYNQLVGAYLSSHPNNPNVRDGIIDVVDKNHLATAGLPDHWARREEWYSYRSIYPGIHVLATLDENSFVGGTNGSNHPIAWYHEFDGGRAFYTGLGHEDASFGEPLLLQHLLGGIRYAMGSGPLDYSKAHATVTPEENRFVRKNLLTDLKEPMELVVAEDGGIFFTELKTGKLQRFDPFTGKGALVHQFAVTTRGGTGLIGVALDPGFRVNRFIYLYYAPLTDAETILFNLSRFTLTPDDTIEPGSEKILLQVPVQENSGSHHGGSLAWDKAGNLYLSTGDSSSPFPSGGYAPLDERPGAEHFSLDSQRSAANTADLKGKILRIHPEPDGSYTIPAGNLFAPGAAKTRPEIYIMGCRNPYRITLNPKSGVLYWADIGPDAGTDGPQGPRGYDEFNQAKKAGNFGWPYFAADNQPYAKWDFERGVAGPLFDPAAPENNSSNNTGLTILPPAMSAMIWYPYGPSDRFPELGQGGRCAIVGEFYSFNPAASSPNRFPAYFDGGLFVFDWMRNWMRILRFDGQENYLRSESFMTANGDFRRPIDLTFGRDGLMYLLEYGSIYGVNNRDASLVRIEYNAGNRAPLAKASVFDREGTEKLSRTTFLTSETKNMPFIKEAIGAVPLTVSFSSRGTRDLDRDDTLTIEWRFDGKTIGSTEQNPTHVYTQPGIYEATLSVRDSGGLVGTDSVTVKVGNEPPTIRIVSADNQSFFWEGKRFTYAIESRDKEDGDNTVLSAAFSYDSDPDVPVTELRQRVLDPLSSQPNPLSYAPVAASDCRACHTLNSVSVGPSFTAVAGKYHGQENAASVLAQKIISGGAGNWGQIPMSAHPQLSLAEAADIARHILSLAEPRRGIVSLGSAGTIAFDQHKNDEPRGVYTLAVSLTDQGSNGVGPLTTNERLIFRSAKVRTIDADAHVGFARFRDKLSPADHKAYVLLKDIDFTGITRFIYDYASLDREGEIEVRLDSFAGPVIARTNFKATGSWEKFVSLAAPLIAPVVGRHDIYFIMMKRDRPNDKIIVLRSIQFEQ